MMLQALYELAGADGFTEDPDFEWKPVAWLVRISEDGRLLGISGTHEIRPGTGTGHRPGKAAKPFLIPRQPTGRAGTKAPPCFFVDNAKYVFGLATKDKSFEDGREKAASFRNLVGECAQNTGDAGAKAVLHFLQSVAEQRVKIGLPESCLSNELFAFIVAPDVDRLVHDRTAIRRYWMQRRAAPASSMQTATAAATCLVSGKPLITPSLVPKILRVPGGATNGIALISFNRNAFESYGWSGNENAFISRAAAESCTAALNRLLDSSCPDPRQPGQTLPRRNLRLSGDTAVCFWTSEPQDSGFCSVFAGLLEANPDEVREMYQSIWRGKAAEVDNPSSFYALTISGTKGRAIVRDWLESTVAVVSKNLAAYFEDLRIVRNTPKPKAHDLPPQFSLRTLLEALAPNGDSADIPPAQIAALVEAALHGTPFPFSLLQRALERARTESGRSEWLDLVRRDARAALIKAVLNRRKRFFPETTTHYQEVRADMDPNNTNEGYVLGRLLAVLERLQQESIGDVNATVIDRYFSGASASPKTVFVRLLKNARHHVGKLRGDHEKGGAAFRLDRLVDELADRFDPKRNGFPAHLNLEQQGLFVLGYHQMRKWLWMSREERDIWQEQYPAAPRAYISNTNKQDNQR